MAFRSFSLSHQSINRDLEYKECLSLKWVNEYTYLGMTFDSIWTWKNHTSKTWSTLQTTKHTEAPSRQVGLCPFNLKHNIQKLYSANTDVLWLVTGHCFRNSLINYKSRCVCIYIYIYIYIYTHTHTLCEALWLITGCVRPPIDAMSLLTGSTSFWAVTEEISLLLCEQDRHCTYNVPLSPVPANIVAVGKQ